MCEYFGIKKKSGSNRCSRLNSSTDKNNKKLSLSHSFSTKNKKAKTLLSKISQKHLLLHVAPSQFSLLIFLIPPSLFGSPSQPSISLTLTPAFTPNTQQWREHSSHLRKQLSFAFFLFWGYFSFNCFLRDCSKCDMWVLFCVSLLFVS